MKSYQVAVPAYCRVYIYGYRMDQFNTAPATYVERARVYVDDVLITILSDGSAAAPPLAEMVKIESSPESRNLKITPYCSYGGNEHDIAGIRIISGGDGSIPNNDYMMFRQQIGVDDAAGDLDYNDWFFDVTIFQPGVTPAKWNDPPPPHPGV